MGTARRRIVYTLASISVLGCVVVAARLLSPRSRTASEVVGRCADTGALWAGYDSTSELIDSSPVIVIARTSTEDYAPLSRGDGTPPEIVIERVLRGQGLTAGEHLTLCVATTLPDTPQIAATVRVLAFLEGRDGELWVAQRGGLGLRLIAADGSVSFDGVAANGGRQPMSSLERQVR